MSSSTSSLACSWGFWQDRWDNVDGVKIQQLSDLGVVATANEFWQFCDRYPVEDLGKDCSLHIFRKHVKPEWEDPANINGGHFRLLPNPTPDLSAQSRRVGRMWLHLVSAVISETFAESAAIVGVAFTNKSYRQILSIWTTTTDPSVVASVQHCLLQLAQDDFAMKFVAHKRIAKADFVTQQTRLHRRTQSAPEKYISVDHDDDEASPQPTDPGQYFLASESAAAAAAAAAETNAAATVAYLGDSGSIWSNNNGAAVNAGSSGLAGSSGVSSVGALSPGGAVGGHATGGGSLLSRRGIAQRGLEADGLRVNTVDTPPPAPVVSVVRFADDADSGAGGASTRKSSMGGGEMHQRSKSDGQARNVIPINSRFLRADSADQHHQQHQPPVALQVAPLQPQGSGAISETTMSGVFNNDLRSSDSGPLFSTPQISAPSPMKDWSVGWSPSLLLTEQQRQQQQAMLERAGHGDDASQQHRDPLSATPPLFNGEFSLSQGSATRGALLSAPGTSSSSGAGGGFHVSAHDFPVKSSPTKSPAKSQATLSPSRMPPYLAQVQQQQSHQLHFAQQQQQHQQQQMAAAQAAHAAAAAAAAAASANSPYHVTMSPQGSGVQPMAAYSAAGPMYGLPPFPPQSMPMVHQQHVSSMTSIHYAAAAAAAAAVQQQFQSHVMPYQGPPQSHQHRGPPQNRNFAPQATVPAQWGPPQMPLPPPPPPMPPQQLHHVKVTSANQRPVAVATDERLIIGTVKAPPAPPAVAVTKANPPAPATSHGRSGAYSAPKGSASSSSAARPAAPTAAAPATRPVPADHAAAAPTKGSSQPAAKGGGQPGRATKSPAAEPTNSPSRAGASGGGSDNGDADKRRFIHGMDPNSVSVKSEAPPFVCRGWLYPIGLNRKERRRVIFAADGHVPGDVVGALYIGEEIPDATIEDTAEYNRLAALSKPPPGGYPPQLPTKAQLQDDLNNATS